MEKQDPLTYLSSTRLTEYPRGSTIYDATVGAPNLYVVLSGRVRIALTSAAGVNTLLRVAGPDELFGQASLVPYDQGVREHASALDPSQLMCWSGVDVQERIEKEPRLGLALIQYFGRQNLLLKERLRVICHYKTGPRVMFALLQLAQLNGSNTTHGATRLRGLTHQAIAEYVGTSREIVTSEMNQLRKLGYIAYSRLFVDIYVEPLMEWIGQGTATRTIEQQPSLRAAG
jgi:CRP/FNR family transcriptional regulator